MTKRPRPLHDSERNLKLAAIACWFSTVSFLAHATDPGQTTGLNAAWQFKYGIASEDLHQDPDGDRFDNLMESDAGTNPYDPADYFRTFSCTTDPGTANTTLTWRSGEGRLYQIESSPDLHFWSIAGNAYGQPGTASTAKPLPTPPLKPPAPTSTPPLSSEKPATHQSLAASRYGSPRARTLRDRLAFCTPQPA